jgi:hypothetical protein
MYIQVGQKVGAFPGSRLRPGCGVAALKLFPMVPLPRDPARSAKVKQVLSPRRAEVDDG